MTEEEKEKRRRNYELYPTKESLVQVKDILDTLATMIDEVCDDFQEHICDQVDMDLCHFQVMEHLKEQDGRIDKLENKIKVLYSRLNEKW